MVSSLPCWFHDGDTKEHNLPPTTTKSNDDSAMVHDCYSGRGEQNGMCQTKGWSMRMCSEVNESTKKREVVKTLPPSAS